MYKSVLFLLGILMVLLPFGSSMNISKVMAIEEYEYDTGKYESYAMDMANQNYYKSQGNDFLKKIYCNNINSNFNGIDVNIDTSLI